MKSINIDDGQMTWLLELLSSLSGHEEDPFVALDIDVPAALDLLGSICEQLGLDKPH